MNFFAQLLLTKEETPQIQKTAKIKSHLTLLRSGAIQRTFLAFASFSAMRSSSQKLSPCSLQRVCYFARVTFASQFTTLPVSEWVERSLSATKAELKH